MLGKLRSCSMYRPLFTKFHGSAMARQLCLLLAFLPLVACRAQDPNDPLADGVEHGLGINGFNYTDRAISSFSVDGTWGGDLAISTPTGGGGGTTCCMRVPRHLPQTYTVRWVAELCKERLWGGGEWFTQFRKGWREKQVVYSGPLPTKPLYFEVHFYPGDDIRIEITDDYTLPRLILQRDERGNRPGGPTEWPVCTADQKRTFTE